MVENTDLLSVRWRKSSCSNGQAECVEIAFVGSEVALRDSKDKSNGPILFFTPNEWRAFTRGVKVGAFD